MGEKSYLYYPGCTLKGMGKPYEESFLSLFKKLDIPLQEIDDWNCCGATAYMSIDEHAAFALAARNLALAEKEDRGTPTIIAPCSACYLVLTKAAEYLKEYGELKEKVKEGLRQADLEYEGRTVIRDPLFFLANDIGIDRIREMQEITLEGIRIVPYYGCQIVRPFVTLDDAENPTTMDRLLDALDAHVLPYALKTRCCGGSLMGTIREVGLRLNHILLMEALKMDPDVIVTVCPLCSFNLEAAQISDSNGNRKVPILYLTQIVGMAVGIPEKELGLSRQMISVKPLLKKMREKELAIG